jgi:TPR repeat protein
MEAGVRPPFSSDSKHIVTIDGHDAVVVEAASSRLITRLTGHSDVVWDATFSPDGSQILTGSKDGTAKLWDAASGRLLATLMGHTGGVRRVAYSPDGSLIGTVSEDRTVKLWNVDAVIAAQATAEHVADEAPTLITECDRAAGIVLDPDKPAHLRGHDKGYLGKEAEVICRQAVAQHPHVRRFKTQLAFALEQNGKFDEARPLFEEAAQAGSATAMFGLADFHGMDDAERAHWLNQAFDAGSALALFAAAYDAVDHGSDKPKAELAIKRALPLLEKAAAAGDPDASAVIAQIYLDDRIVARDVAKATPYLIDGIKAQSHFAIRTFDDDADILPAETRLAVKKLLADAGYLAGAVDSTVDDQTRAALDAWEKSDNGTPSVTQQ